MLPDLFALVHLLAGNKGKTRDLAAEILKVNQKVVQEGKSTWSVTKNVALSQPAGLDIRGKFRQNRKSQYRKQLGNRKKEGTCFMY